MAHVPKPITVSEILPILPRMQYWVSASLCAAPILANLLDRPRTSLKHYSVMLRSFNGQRWKVGMGHESSPTQVCLSYQVGATWMHGRLSTRIQMYYNNYRLL